MKRMQNQETVDTQVALLSFHYSENDSFELEVTPELFFTFPEIWMIFWWRDIQFCVLLVNQIVSREKRPLLHEAW